MEERHLTDGAAPTRDAPRCRKMGASSSDVTHLTKYRHSRAQSLILVLVSRLPADAGRRHIAGGCRSLAIRLGAPPMPKGYAMASWHTP